MIAWEAIGILHHSVLVLSDRRQIGCHGETLAFVTAADSHVLRRSPLIGHRSADARDGLALWLARGLGSELSEKERGRVLVDGRH